MGVKLRDRDSLVQDKNINIKGENYYYIKY